MTLETTKLKQKYRGNCYAAAEALYHVLGGKKSGLDPCYIKLPNGDTHWFLWSPGAILDPTADQFEEPPKLGDYAKGRCSGFMTKKPSKAAQVIIDAIKTRVK